jgi:DNA-binding protein H-NS
MSTKSEKDITPAKLVDGEPIITKELAQKYEPPVLALKEKENRQNQIKSETKAKGGNKKSSMQDAGDGVVRSSGADKPNKTTTAAKPKKETVAIYSDRNVAWTGVGKIAKGYNFVTPEQAKNWLTRNHVREATPEEVASQFGV